MLIYHARILRYGGLEALEERVFIVVLGYVCEEVVGDEGEGPLLDFGHGYARAHNFSRGSLCEGKDGTLDHRASNFTVQLSEGVLVVLGNAVGTDQASCSGGDLSAKSLQLAGLRH
jgi:hypothetical protein